MAPTRPIVPHRIPVWPLVALAVVLACSPRGPGDARRETAVDLLAAFPAATLRRETRTIMPARDEASLGEGWWSAAENDGRDDFRWSSGPRSSLAFEVLRPTNRTLRLDGRPFGHPGASAQMVEVLVNGTSLGGLEWPAERAIRTVPLPATAQRPGPNVLELRYGRADRPRDVLPGSRDPRVLAMAWYGVDVGGHAGPTPEAPAADARNERLILPVDTQVDWFVNLPPGARLEADRSSSRGAHGGRLEIEIQPESPGSPASPKVVSEIAAEGGPLSIELAVPAGTLVRLGVRASRGNAAVDEARADGDDPGGVVIVQRPRVTGIAAGGPVTPTDEPPPTPSGPAQRDGPPPLILVYLVDTLRADRLGCYGHDRPTSPHLDAFAAGATLFEDAVAASSWTKASVASVLTGLWPRAHGANLRTDRLAPEATTLAERLREVGYATAAFVTNPNVTAAFGFDQGFDHFVDLGEATRADAVHEAALHWLGGRDDERPVFLYLHTLDPHSPYDPPAAFRQSLAPDVPPEVVRDATAILDDMQAGRRTVDAEMVRHLGALYDAEIAANDAAFGVLVSALRERDRFDDALIVMLSDHGEEFYEHGNFQHGRALHRESLHVPLLVKLPGQRVGRRIERRVRSVDVFPTVLEVAGSTPPELPRGRSLVALAAGRAPAADTARALAYLHLDGPARAAIHDGPWKLIQGFGSDGAPARPRLFEIASDRHERDDLAEARPVRRGYLASLLGAELSIPAALTADPTVLDEEMRGRLRALGYLE